MNLNDLKENFKRLSIESKRDQLNAQTKELLEIVNKIIAYNETNYYDYVQNNNVSEDEFLTEEYVQIFEAKQKLIDVFK